MQNGRDGWTQWRISGKRSEAGLLKKHRTSPRIVKEAFEAANIPNYGPHSFRHTERGRAAHLRSHDAEEVRALALSQLVEFSSLLAVVFGAHTCSYFMISCREREMIFRVTDDDGEDLDAHFETDD